ncbi:MAG: metallophosphoesterase family protein [Acidobacteriaceae bacterium]|nr:metallophosphoesterase family protein [Acidobacteriaceae bacterium]
MRIAILSDIHDNLWNLEVAMDAIEGCDAMICCGDLCSPFVVDELARFRGDIHLVFGNNDADLFRITAKAAKLPAFHIHGEFFEAQLAGKRVAANHFDLIARPVAKSGNFELVCFGHNHEFEISRDGGCLLINPGPIMGARFSGGKRVDVTPTFVVYDTVTAEPEVFGVNPGRTGVVRMERVLGV